MVGLLFLILLVWSVLSHRMLVGHVTLLTSVFSFMLISPSTGKPRFCHCWLLFYLHKNFRVFKDRCLVENFSSWDKKRLQARKVLFDCLGVGAGVAVLQR